MPLRSWLCSCRRRCRVRRRVRRRAGDSINVNPHVDSMTKGYASALAATAARLTPLPPPPPTRSPRCRTAGRAAYGRAEPHGACPGSRASVALPPAPHPSPAHAQPPAMAMNYLARVEELKQRLDRERVHNTAAATAAAGAMGNAPTRLAAGMLGVHVPSPRRPGAGGSGGPSPLGLPAAEEAAAAAAAAAAATRGHPLPCRGRRVHSMPTSRASPAHPRAGSRRRGGGAGRGRE